MILSQFCIHCWTIVHIPLFHPLWKSKLMTRNGSVYSIGLYSSFPINVFNGKTFFEVQNKKKIVYLFLLFFVLFLLIIQVHVHELQVCGTNEELTRTLEFFFIFIGNCNTCSGMLYRCVYFLVAWFILILATLYKM